MGVSWYYILIYVAVGSLLLWVSDKYRIIRSKPLRYFLVIVAYTGICWLIYDLALA